MAMTVDKIETIAAEAECSLCAVRAVLGDLARSGAVAAQQRLGASARVRAAAGTHSIKCPKKKP